MLEELSCAKELEEKSKRKNINAINERKMFLKQTQKKFEECFLPNNLIKCTMDNMKSLSI